MDGIQLFNKAITRNIIDNRKFLRGRSHYLPDYTSMTIQLVKQEKVRKKHLKDHLTVPPIMIMSVTNDCNLTCHGCYANAQDRSKDLEMTIENIDRLISEGVDLGVSIIMLAGGEPLMKKGLLEVVSKYKKTIFIMFTNGMMINDKIIDQLKKMKHLIPVFSLEGAEETTDLRRGKGVHDAVMSVMKSLDHEKMLFGSSITLTSQNYDEVMNDDYIQNLEDKGNRTLFLIEYVPCNGDKALCLSESQKDDLLGKIKHIQKTFDILPIPLPGDESHFEGCLAAGRGFVHISSTGALEACPFAPYSDVTLKHMSLKEALRSRLLTEIRLNHHLLEESEGGCALFENPQWVTGLVTKGSKRTCSSIV